MCHHNLQPLLNRSDSSLGLDIEMFFACRLMTPVSHLLLQVQILPHVLFDLVIRVFLLKWLDWGRKS